MTEKKRRGRPPGTGKNKPKAVHLAEEKVEMPEGISELKGNEKRPDGFAIDCDRYNVPPFPEDWDKLSKVAKLQWLTANKK